jgi:serine O-acetyltransferase
VVSPLPESEFSLVRSSILESLDRKCDFSPEALSGPDGRGILMAQTHPESLKQLLQWMAEDVAVNRRRGGLLSVVAVVSFRLNQFGVRGRGIASRIARIASLPLVAFARLGIGVELPGSLACGRRLLLAHGGRGVILHPEVRLGDDVALASGSGAGVAFPKPGAPVIGDGVYFGANASVIGDVSLGDGELLFEHALVTRSIPAGMLAVGVPAKVVGRAPSQESAPPPLRLQRVRPDAVPMSMTEQSA